MKTKDSLGFCSYKYINIFYKNIITMFVCSSFRVYCVDRMVLENYFCVRCGHVPP